MKRLLLSATAVLALLSAPTLQAQTQAAPTAAEAQAFVAHAEAELDKMGVYGSHAAWLQATYINVDSNFIWREGGRGGQRTSLCGTPRRRRGSTACSSTRSPGASST